jgi:hypothetical protein
MLSLFVMSVSATCKKQPVILCFVLGSDRNCILGTIYISVNIPKDGATVDNSSLLHINYNYCDSNCDITAIIRPLISPY